MITLGIIVVLLLALIFVYKDAEAIKTRCYNCGSVHSAVADDRGVLNIPVCTNDVCQESINYVKPCDELNIDEIPESK